VEQVQRLPGDAGAAYSGLCSGKISLTNSISIKCVVSGKVSSKEDDIRAAYFLPAVTKYSTLNTLKLQMTWMT